MGFHKSCRHSYLQIKVNFQENWRENRWGESDFLKWKRKLNAALLCGFSCNKRTVRFDELKTTITVKASDITGSVYMRIYYTAMITWHVA